MEWFDPHRYPNELPHMLTDGLIGGVICYGHAENALADFLENSKKHEEKSFLSRIIWGKPVESVEKGWRLSKKCGKGAGRGTVKGGIFV